MRLQSLVLVTLTLLLLSACSDRAELEQPIAALPTASQETTSSVDVAAPTEQNSQVTVTADVQSLDEINELITAQQGKIVVVDLWALW
jgi:ABC-type enterochelin transport system substrate-binding protein